VLSLHHQVIRVHKYYYYKLGRQKPLLHKSILFIKREANNPPATTSLLRFILGHHILGHHLSAKTTKFCCFLTYNNMGSKSLSTKCTFTSLTRQNKKLSRICWLKGVKVRLTQESRLCFAKMLSNSGSLKIQFYLQVKSLPVPRVISTLVQALGLD
jgi:hypothetical protein